MQKSIEVLVNACHKVLAHVWYTETTIHSSENIFAFTVDYTDVYMRSISGFLLERFWNKSDNEALLFEVLGYNLLGHIVII